jgi:hypothetical protein
MAWLTIQEGWYGGVSYIKLRAGQVFEVNPSKNNPNNYLADARKSAEGYGNGRYWNWGNTSTPEIFINYNYVPNPLLPELSFFGVRVKNKQEVIS